MGRGKFQVSSIPPVPLPKYVPVYMMAEAAGQYLGLSPSAIRMAFSRGRLNAAAWAGDWPLFNEKVLDDYASRRADWAKKNS